MNRKEYIKKAMEEAHSAWLKENEKIVSSCKNLEQEYVQLEVGKRIRIIRQSKGMSLQNVSDLSNRLFTRSSLSLIELGTQSVDVFKLAILAIIFECNARDFLPENFFKVYET